MQEESEIHARLWFNKGLCSSFVDFVVRTMVKWGEISQEPPPRLPPDPYPLELG